MTYSVKGFDVAVVNRGTLGQRIDWPVVAAAKEADFCGIRLLDGTLRDADADYNRLGAETIRIPYLGYQAVYPWIDPVRQAIEFAAAVKDSPYRYAGDLEKDGGLSPADYMEFAHTYVNECEQRIGREMMIYTGPWFGSTFLQGKFADNPLWVANPYNAQPSLPSGWTKWVIWQFSWIEKFAGVADTTVDADYFNGTLEEMRAFFGVSELPPQSELEQRVLTLEIAFGEISASLDSINAGLQAIDAQIAVLDDRVAALEQGGSTDPGDPGQPPAGNWIEVPIIDEKTPAKFIKDKRKGNQVPWVYTFLPYEYEDENGKTQRVLFSNDPKNDLPMTALVNPTPWPGEGGTKFYQLHPQYQVDDTQLYLWGGKDVPLQE